MLGLGLSIPQVAARGSRSLVAAIRSLFAANEPGVWYDPSDLSTLFQDSAGTTPVTAVEQPVGLILDKSKGLVLGDNIAGATSYTLNGIGNTTVASAPADGWYFITARVVSGGGTVRWSALSPSYTGSFASAGNTIFARVFVFSGSTIRLNTSSAVDLVVDTVMVQSLPGNHAYQTTATSMPVLSARVNQYLATETLATQNVTTLAAQYRLSFEGTGTVTLSGTATGVYSAGSHLITCTAGTLTSTVSGSVTKADLRVANTGAGLPAYQRVNTETDYDTAGFPYYLRFDGVDDWLVTNTITPGTDKVQVFAGVRKLSDAARGLVAELSTAVTNNNGSFNMNAPYAANPSYQFASRGTSVSDAPINSGYVAPTTDVLTGIGNISGDSATPRINGTQVASSTADQGTGNYGNYPLYIGRRGGTTLQFNGHLYSLIVRFGSNLPIGTIEKTEKYINTKTRAY